MDKNNDNVMDKNNDNDMDNTNRLTLRRQCTIRPHCLLCQNEKLNQDRLYLICQECVNNIKTFRNLYETTVNTNVTTTLTTTTLTTTNGLCKLPKDIFMLIREYLYYETNNTKYAEAIKRELAYRLLDDYHT